MKLFGRHRGSASAFLVAGGLTLVLAVTTACGSGGDGGSTSHTPTASKGTVLMISPDHGSPDTRILVTGCGFEANKPVKIEASVLDPRTITADASGAFLSDTTVPSIAAGTYIVRASTSNSVFAEAIFTVERQTGDAGKSPTPQSSPETARC